MSPSPIRNILTSSTCALVLFASLVGEAAAARIAVSTSNDVVADDGLCSLREAVNAANLNRSSGRAPGECIAGVRSRPDVIVLRRGVTYRLTRQPRGEDGNAGGDLDVTESLVVRGKGPRTVVENALGDPAIPGDGDRLFHVDPHGKGGVDVAFEHLTLARGDVGCTGARCSTGGSAVEQRGSGALRFTACRVQRNGASCSGEQCGGPFDGAPIHTLFGGALTVRKTKIKKNQVQCASDFCTLGAAAIAMATDGGVALAPGATASSGALELTRVTIAENVASCGGNGCSAGRVVGVFAESVAVQRLVVASNELRCSGDGCAARALVDLYAQGSAVIDDAELTDNLGDCVGEVCFVDAALSLGGESATLRSAGLQRNRASCEGASCIVAVRYAVGGGSVEAGAVALSGDVVTCEGKGCGVYGLLGGEAGGTIALGGLAIEDNQQTCDGEECVVGVVTGWRGASLQTSSLGIARNLSGCTGTRCQAVVLASLEGTDGSGHSATVLRDNLLGCGGEQCRVGEALLARAAQGDLALVTPTIAGNTVACGGKSCTLSPVVELQAGEGLVIDVPRLASNTADCAGDQCTGAEILHLDGATLALDSGVVADNVARCTGSACRSSAVVVVSAAASVLARSSVARNASRCDGDDCGAGPGGALRNRAQHLTIVDSSLTDNETDGYGAAVFADPGSELRLERALLAANAAGLRGTMEFGGFGGAVYNAAASGKKAVLSVVSSEISRNRALRNGGGILNAGQVASLAGSAVTSNTIGNCVDQGGSGCP